MGIVIHTWEFAVRAMLWLAPAVIFSMHLLLITLMHTGLFLELAVKKHPVEMAHVNWLQWQGSSVRIQQERGKSKRPSSEWAYSSRSESPKILQTLQWHKASSINFNQFIEIDWLKWLCLVNNQTLRQHVWWNHLVNNNCFTILQAYKTSTSLSDQCSQYWAGPSTSHWSHTQKQQFAWWTTLRHNQQYSRTLLQDNGQYNHNDFSDRCLIRTRIHGKGTAGIPTSLFHTLYLKEWACQINRAQPQGWWNQ